MKYAFNIGRIAGIKIFIHWTFLLLIGWIVFADVRAELTTSEILWHIGLVCALFGCVVMHEMGHALVARRFKVNTRYIVLLPIGGIAQMDRIPEEPAQELLISIAGPLVNFGIALLLLPFADMQSLLPQESAELPTPGSATFLSYLAFLNLWLAIFNLIPAFPMDGGRILRALISFRAGRMRATKIASSVGQVFGVIFFLSGLLLNPFLVVIGLFIFISGQMESAMVQTHHFLHKYVVKDVMMNDIPMLDGDAGIKEAARALLDSQNSNFVVTVKGVPTGVIGKGQIVKAVQGGNDTVRISEVMSPNLTFASIDTPLDEIWNIMQTRKMPIVLVGTKENIVGMVEAENVSEFILMYQTREVAA